MEYQETGRPGRITKNLRKQGFENEMEEIVYDSKQFPKLNKKLQTEYVETVVDRMAVTIGKENTNKILFECGSQCCGKSWANFVINIRKDSQSIDDFFQKLNKEEEKYNTTITYNQKDNSIKVNRSKCICGLINKGSKFTKNKNFCNCSIGHMSAFFNAVFAVKEINFVSSIYNGDRKCEWVIALNDSKSIFK